MRLLCPYFCPIMASGISCVQGNDGTLANFSARIDDLEKRMNGRKPLGDRLASMDEVEELRGELGQIHIR